MEIINCILFLRAQARIFVAIKIFSGIPYLGMYKLQDVFNGFYKSFLNRK